MKIIELNINEILLNEKACSDLIRKACLRTPATPYYVSGMCSTPGKVFVILEPSKEDIDLPQYRFAPLSSLDEKNISAEVSSRYYAGFTTIASFVVDDKLWALFALKKTENKI